MAWVVAGAPAGGLACPAAVMAAVAAAVAVACTWALMMSVMVVARVAISAFKRRRSDVLFIPRDCERRMTVVTPDHRRLNRRRQFRATAAAIPGDFPCRRQFDRRVCQRVPGVTAVDGADPDQPIEYNARSPLSVCSMVPPTGWVALPVPALVEPASILVRAEARFGDTMGKCLTRIEGEKPESGSEVAQSKII